MVVLSRAEVAHKFGENPYQIDNLVKTGKLHRLDGGGFDEATVEEEYGQYLKNSNRAKAVAAQNKAVKDRLGISFGEQREKTEAAKATYTQAKATKEAALAKIKMLELQQLQGELIAKTEVEEITSRIAGSVLQQILAVPVRIATQCEGKEARQIEHIMWDELNRAIERLRHSFLEEQ